MTTISTQPQLTGTRSLSDSAVFGPFEYNNTTLIWCGDGRTVRIDAWGENSLRVRAVPCGNIQDTDYSLLPAPKQHDPITISTHRSGDREEVTLTHGKITAVARATSTGDAQSGFPKNGVELEFLDENGHTLLAELGSGGALKREARCFESLATGGWRLTAQFAGDPSEKLFGMGLYQHDVFDLKGSTLELMHRNSQASIPFVLSSRGYGLLWHNPAIGRATFGRNQTEWVAESTQQLDYWITAGSSPRQIVRAYSDATGHVPMMPDFAMGYWQSNLRYWNQQQLLEVAQGFRSRNIPLDVLVADFFHWRHLGDYSFDPEFWPDPASMVAQLRNEGVHLMVSIWPQVSPASENYRDLAGANALTQTVRGLPAQMAFGGPSVFVDPTSVRGRQAVWNICRRNYHDIGIRHFWLDEAEPEYGTYDLASYHYAAGSALAVGNLYPQAFSRHFYDGQKLAGDEDIVNLVRCAWSGSQRYGALVWSGDIHSDWATLRRQITAGIQMGIAGISWFTTDIGGFAGGHVDDPNFHELLIRWFQFGALCPVMRMHGDRAPSHAVTAADGSPREHSGASNEPWSYGGEVEKILTAYIRLRRRLRPYIRMVMQQAHRDGDPVIRAMFYEFDGEEQCWSLDSQYMFGPDILVAPVLEAGARRRSIYLPGGCSWINPWDGRRYEGGQWIAVQAPLEQIPLMLRNEALLPLFTE